MALVWDVLHRVCTTLGPVVVLLKDVEKTVCGTQDSFHSFVQAFGSASKTPGRSPRKEERQGHIVLLGGTSVSEPKEEQPITLRYPLPGSTFGQQGKAAHAFLSSWKADLLLIFHPHFPPSRPKFYIERLPALLSCYS